MAVQLARHRVRKLNAEGDFTSEEFEALCEKHGNVCFRCGDGDVLLTPDHVIPLSVGGSCNSWKNIKAVDYRPKRLSRTRSLLTRAAETPQKKQKRRFVKKIS